MLLAEPRRLDGGAITRSALLAACVWLVLQLGTSHGEPLWPEDAQRFRVGLNIFAATLGAIESLEARCAPDGKLRVVVVFDGDPGSAREAAADLRAIGAIRGLPLQVTILTSEALALHPWSQEPLGGIFVANVGTPPQRLRAWSQEHQTLVFSPFAGDVEAGAVAGIYVSDRILPYVNLPQAKRAGIQFKRFFLQVARPYD